jgi:polyhydroxyalkanoate synthase subunit PhaC
MLGLPLPRPGGLPVSAGGLASGLRLAGFASPRDALTAAGNLFDATVGGGLADTRRMPSSLIDEGPLRRVHRYLPLGRAARRSSSLPILLVPPLAAPAICFDLRRGCSVAEHLLRRGHETYLVDYGRVRFSDRSLGLEHWIEHVIPNAVRAVSEDAGGRPVQLVGWCLGGILALLAHCADPELAVASTALVASPFDFSRVPLVAPLRPIAAVTQGQLVTQLYRALGGAPAPLVKRAYQLAGLDKYVMKPWTVISNLDDRELLAQIEAVDIFMDGMQAYPGRTFGQLYHRFFRSNDLADGRLALTERTLDLADVRVPVLAIAGRGDGIAPVPACHHVGGLLPNAASVALETAPGGHLGVLTGRAARGTTWVLVDRFLAEHEALPSDRRRRRPAA